MVEEKDTCQGQSCPCSRGYHRDNGLDGYVKKVVDKLLSPDANYLAYRWLERVGRHGVVPEVSQLGGAVAECHLVIEQPGCRGDELERERVEDDRWYLADACAQEPGRAVIAVAEEGAALVLRHLDVAGAQGDEERERLHLLRRHLGRRRYQRLLHVAAGDAQVRVERAEGEAVTVVISEGAERRRRLRCGQAQLNQGGRIVNGFSDASVQAIGGDHFLDGQYSRQVDPLDTPPDVGEARAYLGAGGNLVQ